MDKIFASNSLEGLEINGWKVAQMLPKPDRSKKETGGNFSTCYIVEKGTTRAFMKVLDFERIYREPVTSAVTRTQIIERETSAFNYEKELSDYCKGKHLRNIVFYIESGEVQIEGFVIPDVSYIIYEEMEGDIRKIFDFSSKIEIAARIKNLSDKIKSLHSVAVGLDELHMSGISHQDLKPSNVLYQKGESKIGDLGRSLCLSGDVACPYNLMGFNGDWSYAAPECFFKASGVSGKEMLYQIDNYMLGGLICFYITGVTFNALMDYHLPDDLKLHNRIVEAFDFKTVLPDILNAYQEALSDFSMEIPIDEVRDGLVEMVGYLCYPDPSRRGHKKAIKTSEANYDLKRAVTQLDVLFLKAKYAIIKQADGII